MSEQEMPLVASKKRAQSMVEFALTLPLFLFLMLAVFDFSRMLFMQMSITNAARELARTAAISTSTTQGLLNSFNNTVIMLAPSSGTDTVVVDVRNRNGTQVGTMSCTGMPFLTCSGAPGSWSTWISAAGGGYVDVTTSYKFVFSPFFDALFQQATRVSSTLQFPAYVHTVKAYVE